MYRYNAAYKEINDVSLERMKMAVEYIDRYDDIGVKSLSIAP